MENILFLTNSELGQCNVAFAVAEEFLRRGKFRVHFASFSPLAEQIDELSLRVSSAQPVEFHEIWGPSMTNLAVRTDVGLIHHRPGIRGAMQGFQKVSKAMSSWTPSEYGRAYQSCLDILERVHPDVVVVDPILHVGLDACRTINARMVVLWPVPLKDVVIMSQPKGGLLWKYPMTGSGYSFPLPWTLVLSNIYLAVCAALALMLSKSLPDKKAAAEQEYASRSPFPLQNAYQKTSLNLTPAFKEMDFPLYIPDNVISCGPIIRKFEPLSETDPELDAWLERPTVLISLGSHVKPEESVAIEMARGVQIILEQHYPNIQVLWKLKYDWEGSETFKKILGASIAAGSVRVVSWIQPDIMSVLETGQIITYVHHGGANSYFEACKAGIPQVVLPQWLDTYDCATRVEWLGLGVHGSRKAAPGTDSIEFSNAVLRVLGDDCIRTRSFAMRDLCQSTEGRVVAHDQIAEYAV